MTAKNRKRLFKWSLALLLAYTLFGFLIAPMIIKYVILSQLPKQISRQVSLERVRVNPFTCAVTIGGFAIREPSGAPFVSWDEVFVNLNPTALVLRELVVSEVSISNAYGHVQINRNGTFNFSDILKKFNTVPETEAKPSSGRPLIIRIGKLHIASSRINYDDLSRGTPFSTRVGPIDITLNDFSTDPANRNPYGFTAVTEANEKISWRGFFSLGPIRSSGEFAVQNIKLKKYAPYYNDFINLTTHDGSLDVSASYRVELTDRLTVAQVTNLCVGIQSLKIGERNAITNVVEIPSLSLSNTDVDVIGQVARVGTLTSRGARFQLERMDNGQLNLISLVIATVHTNAPSVATTAPTPTNMPLPIWSASVRHIELEDWSLHVNRIFGEETVSWQSLQISNIRAKTDPLSIAVDSVLLQDPNIQVLIPASLTNMLAALPKTGETNTATTASAVETPPPLINIGSITVTNGTVGYTDQSLNPEAAITLNRMGVQLTGLSSDAGSRADILVEGRVDDVAPIEVSGHINPMNIDAATDMQVMIKNVNLVPLSSYSGRYLGYMLRKGKVTVILKYDIDQRKLNAQNQVIIEQFTFGDKIDSPQAVNLPVKVGVAILKDRNGKIQLDIPVEGRIDDPKFRYWGAVWQVLGNLFTKIFTAPFSMLGSMFGGGNEELSFVQFAPGNASLGADQSAKLDVLIKALTERPSLNLEIAGSIDPIKDVEPLKRERLTALLTELRARKEPAVTNILTTTARTAYLREAYAEALPRIRELQAAAAVTNPPVVAVTNFHSNVSNFAPANVKPVIATDGVNSTQAKKIAATLTVDEMERQYFTLIDLTPDDYRRLAVARVAATAAYFKTKGNIADDRLLVSSSAATPILKEGARAVFSLQ